MPRPTPDRPVRAQITAARFRAGVLPNDPAKPRLRLASFLLAGAPAAPAAADFTHQPVIGMLGNNQYADCVFAGNGHTVEQQTFYGQGVEATVTTQQVLDEYSRVTGFNPLDPSTDNGATIQSGLDDLRRIGLAGHKIAAFAELYTLGEAKIAVAEFGSAAVGMWLPASALTQFNSHQPWDVLDPDGGMIGTHRVTLFGYDTTHLYVATWDAIQKMTHAFWNQYVFESWAQISEDWISAATGRDPVGVDKVALGKQFAELTGEPNPFAPLAPEPTGPAAPATSVPTVAAKLKSLLQARGGLAGVQILDGMPWTPDVDYLAILDADPHEQRSAGMRVSSQPREEEWTQHVRISALRKGDDDHTEVVERAYQLAAELAAQLRDDPTIGGALGTGWATVTGLPVQKLGPDKDGQREAVIAARLTCRARV